MKKNLLIMRLSAMGDVAMTIPVIASFLTAHPDVEVTMLSAPRLEPLFSHLPRLTFVPVDTKKEYAGNLGMYRLFKHLRKNYTFDAMIDLHDVVRSKILRFLFKWIARIPVHVIDKGRAEKKALTQEKNKTLKQLKSSIERYRDTFAKAGYPFELSYTSLATSEPKAELQSLFTANTKIIGIAPYAQHKGKIYPIEKTEKVIEHYSQRGDVEILLFGGGEQEKAQLEAWEQKYDHVHSLAHKYSLMEELAIMQRCQLLLTMDSANMHLASLVGTPVVSIWGATHPYAGFYGYNQSIENAIQVDLPCRPCSIYGNKPCKLGDYPCMRQITEEKVIQKIDSILG